VLELMITVALAALLIAIALPSFRELIMRNNVTTLANSLVIALNSARSEAVRRGTFVEVAPVSGTSWTAGWNIKADTSFDQTFATIVGTQGAAPSGYKVCPNAKNATAPGTSSTAVFDATGALRYAALVDVNIVRPDGKTAQFRWISVAPSGEIKTQMYTSTSSALTTCP